MSIYLSVCLAICVCLRSILVMFRLMSHCATAEPKR